MRSELPTLVGGIGPDSLALGPGADWAQGQIVGREAEMHLLSQALERTRIGGEPASITLLGPKGAGKTRLLEAFVNNARKLDTPAVRIIECAGREGEHRYGLFSRLLRDRFELRDDMTDDEVRWEVRARVSDVLGDRKVGDVLYFLGRLLEIPFRESPITRAIEHDLAEMDMVCRAVTRSFFEADARRAPLCLVVEDVHLCEDASLGLLRSLVESVDAPFFVLCTARTELLNRSVAWARSERHKLVHLAAQTHDETAVAARIAVLSAEELSLLEGAARMGSVFWAGALIALERSAMTAPAFWDPEANEPKARRLLASLAERDYVLKLPDSSFPGDEEYIFKHSLERERILASTSPEVARHLSQIIGEWLERQPVLRDHEDNLCTLAEHRQRAGLLVAAGRAYLEAGEVARRRDAVNAAADCFAKGIALLGEEESATRLEAIRRLSGILVTQGKREAALQRFSEMAALAFRLNAPLEGAEAHVGIARLKADADDTTAALRHLRAAIGLYSQAGAEDEVGHATAELDKLLDKAAAATAKRAPAPATNGTAKATPAAEAPVEAAAAAPVEAAAAPPAGESADQAPISEAPISATPIGEIPIAALMEAGPKTDDAPSDESSVIEAAVNASVIDAAEITAGSVGATAEGLDVPISASLDAIEQEPADAPAETAVVVLDPASELGETPVNSIQVVADVGPSDEAAPISDSAQAAEVATPAVEQPFVGATDSGWPTAETIASISTPPMEATATPSGDVEATSAESPSDADSAPDSAESADAANANANAHAGAFELVGDVPPSAVEPSAVEMIPESSSAAPDPIDLAPPAPPELDVAASLAMEAALREEHSLKKGAMGEARAVDNDTGEDGSGEGPDSADAADVAAVDVAPVDVTPPDVTPPDFAPADIASPDVAPRDEETTMVAHRGEQAAMVSASSDSEFTSSSDRPTPPTPLPAVAALAAATLPSSWEDPPVTRRAPALQADLATSPGLEPSFDDDAVAIDIDFSDEESSPVTDWIELKGADPDVGAVVERDAAAAGATASSEDLASLDSDTDGAPTVRRFVAAEASFDTTEPDSAETRKKAERAAREANGAASDDDPETKKKSRHSPSDG